MGKRKKGFLGVDGQIASCCVGEAVRGERHRKQQITNAHTDPSKHIRYFRVW